MCCFQQEYVVEEHAKGGNDKVNHKESGRRDGFEKPFCCKSDFNSVTIMHGGDKAELGIV